MESSERTPPQPPRLNAGDYLACLDGVARIGCVVWFAVVVVKVIGGKDWSWW